MNMEKIFMEVKVDFLKKSKVLNVK
jgi:hypothetical protein